MDFPAWDLLLCPSKVWPPGGDLPNQMAMAGVAPPEVPAMDGVAPVAVMQQVGRC